MIPCKTTKIIIYILLLGKNTQTFYNYQTPEIYHGIADFSADSLALAVEASKTIADIIVMMQDCILSTETAKLMSPNKKS